MYLFVRKYFFSLDVLVSSCALDGLTYIIYSKLEKYNECGKREGYTGRRIRVLID